MNIWLINPFDPLPGEFFREGRYASLSRILVKNGHQVVWWTSDFFHANKSYRIKNTQPFEGCKINYINVPRYKKNISFKRIYNHWVYGKRFLKLAGQENELPDVIIASCPPLGSAGKAIRFAHKYNIKCIVDVQDLWPEGLPLSEFLKGMFLFPVKKYANSIYCNADGIICVAQEFMDRVDRSRIFNSKCLVYLGIDLSVFDCLAKKSNSSCTKKKEFLVVYIGTGGRSYDIDTVLKTAKLLEKNNNVKFMFAGIGFMEKAVKNSSLKNCYFLGLLEYEKLICLLKKSDVGLNPMVKKAKNAFPNKVFDYMAAGLPILNSKEGELATVISQYNIGLQYESENPYSLKEKILWFYNNKEQKDKMACNSRRLVEEKFNRNIQYQKIINFIEKIVYEGK